MNCTKSCIIIVNTIYKSNSKYSSIRITQIASQSVYSQGQETDNPGTMIQKY